MNLQLKNFNNKGQVFSTDLMIAAIVFLFMLSFGMVYSNDVANRVTLSEIDNLRFEAALTTANALLYSAGSPGNWQNQTDLTAVSSIGFVESKNVINPVKLARLITLSGTNFEKIRDLLGVSKYGLKVEIIELQNNQLLYEFGIDPGINQQTSTVNRFALLNGQVVIVRIKVFEQ